MTYVSPPATGRDWARLRLGDTSNDPATERFDDGTYDALIVETGNWRLAAASLARSLAAQGAAVPRTLTGFTATGDLSLAWSATDPVKAWLAIATALEAEAAAAATPVETVGGPFTLTAPFLTGLDCGGEW